MYSFNGRILFVVVDLGSELLHPLASDHAGDADGDDGDGEELTHVERQASLEGLLDVLEELDDETRREDERQAESDIETCADLLRMLLVEGIDDEEEDGVADSLVELSRMARVLVDLLEDERPGHVGDLTDDLGVHEVAKSDERRRDTRADTHVVEHCPHVDFVAVGVDEDGDDHSDDATVGGEPFIACELPRPVGHEMDREEHLHDVLARGEEIVGLIEEAVAETGTDEHTDEDVHEERVELLVGDLLILVELRHEECA